MPKKPHGNDVKKFNPYQFIGNICHYYNMSFNTVFKEMSYQNLIMLSNSVPNNEDEDKKKETKEKKYATSEELFAYFS